MASNQNVQKADPAGVLAAAREMVGKLRDQAKDGQIDGALLDQMAGVLDVSFDAASDPHSAAASASAGQSGADLSTASSLPTPSVPSDSGGDSSDLPSMSGMPSGDESSSDSSEDPTMPSAPLSSVSKRDNGDVFSSRPPSPALIFDHSEDARAMLPQFVQALESGRLHKAQQIAGNQPAFDMMFNMAMKYVMTEGGITYSNIKKLHGGAPGELDLSKAMTSSDVPGIYLMRLAKLMLPVYAGLRRRLPAATPQTGSNQATWRAQIGFGALSFANLMNVAEAAIGDSVPTSFLTFNSPYKDTSLNDAVTLKAIAAARGYDDPLQIAVIRAMTALLQGEERNIIGQNYAALAVPGTITVASGSAASATLTAGSYVVGISALTYRGWLAGSKGGSATVGETMASYSAMAAPTSATSTITATWAAVPGAVAYNVYLTASGSAVSGSTGKWQQTVTINKAVITAASGSANLTPGTADSTANTNGYEGLIQWCQQSTIWGVAIPSKAAVVDNAGAGLTTSASGITQFDSILASLWTNWQIAPSLMVMSPNMAGTVTGKLLAMNSTNLYRIEVGSERGQIQGGAFVTGYVNKYAPFADGTPRYVDILPHPYMADGQVEFLTETIPYPMSRESRGFALDVLIPYTYFPLAQNTIQYPFALTLSETLECFHPAAQTALVGVDYTL